MLESKAKSVLSDLLREHIKTLKCEKFIYDEIKEEVKKFFDRRTDMVAVIEAYKENKNYIDYRIAFSWDILRVIGQHNNVCYITKCYNFDMNDNHITSMLLHLMNDCFENNLKYKQ